jgi:hypothetical protein
MEMFDEPSTKYDCTFRGVACASGTGGAPARHSPRNCGRREGCARGTNRARLSGQARPGRTFTSEGCSSCPPADALLSRLGRTQPVRGADIIALEEHVGYWDRLGWKDPFSSEAATARQNEYGEAFGGRQVYTPQMIVDGRAEFFGSSDTDALRAIRAASQTAKPNIQLSWETGDSLAIHVEPLTNASAGDGAQLFLVIAENMLHSDVKHGENAGRALEHNGVVRQLLPLGKIDAAPAGFSSTVAVHPAHEWNRANLRAVVFVQERRGRHVLAVAAIPFPKA